MGGYKVGFLVLVLLTLLAFATGCFSKNGDDPVFSQTPPVLTEPADFAVKIEEVMAEECSSYECQLLDDDEIGILWTFLIEDTISGYLGIEDNEDTLKVKTVSVGLHLKDITDYSREEVLAILEANAELINANFSVVKFPSREPEEKEPVFVENYGKYQQADG